MEKKSDFEKDLLRLEEIVNELERGECPLEQAMALFEEGARLSAACSRTLEQAQQKITQLSQIEEE